MTSTADTQEIYIKIFATGVSASLCDQKYSLIMSLLASEDYNSLILLVNLASQINLSCSALTR